MTNWHKCESTRLKREKLCTNYYSQYSDVETAQMYISYKLPDYYSLKHATLQLPVALHNNVFLLSLDYHNSSVITNNNT